MVGRSVDRSIDMALDLNIVIYLISGQFTVVIYMPSLLFVQQDSKFGFGGVKKGMKRNTAQSFSDVSSFNSAKHSKAPRARSGNMVRNNYKKHAVKHVYT